ncbi:MAG: hypothetical protein Q9195_002303 [Heterodermia aff. obscurata]
MAYPTQPAFIHTGGWGPSTRAHPALAFLEEYAASHFDQQAWNTNHFSEWHHADWHLTKADNSVVSGGHEVWTEGIPSIYGPFAGHLHDPTFLIVWETEEGYEMIGEANVFLDLGGAEEGEGGKKEKDSKGKEWDAVMPGSFHFWFARAEGGEGNTHGLVMKRTQLFADSAPVKSLMVKKGLLKKEDLGVE